MRRGTTPTITINTNTSVSDYDTVIITIESAGHQTDFTGDRLTLGARSIDITLTQEETLALEGRVRVQLRAIKEGMAVASEIATMWAGDILKDGVIS